MHIHIVAVGKRQPDWIEKGVREYEKRFPAEVKLQFRELQPVRRHKHDNRDKILRKEAESIRAAVPAGHYLVALEETGSPRTTRALGTTLSGWMRDGVDASFVIGGADGLDAELKNEADELLSLSAFTLPHGLARIVLVEQLYRALTLIRNHPYHRE